MREEFLEFRWYIGIFGIPSDGLYRSMEHDGVKISVMNSQQR